MYCTQRREGAKIIGMRAQFGLAWIAGGIIAAERFFPSYFFVLFVLFVAFVV